MKNNKWRTRLNDLEALDDEAQEEAYNHLRADWAEEYIDAFVRIAVKRGWTEGNAMLWATDLVVEAWHDAVKFDYNPEKVARADVELSEEGGNENEEEEDREPDQDKAAPPPR